MRILIPLVLLASSTLAQEDHQLAALIANVREAHGGEQETEVDRFRAALRLKSVERDEKSIEMDITAAFLAPRLLRYKVEEPGEAEVKERGMDDRGVWRRIGDDVESVSGKDDAQEVEAVRQHVRLARQLLGFLDPASVLERLEDASGPVARDLPVKKGEQLPCKVVTGIAERFPMFAPPDGPDGEPIEPRCRLEAWIDARSHLLVAVLVTPLDAQGRAVAAPEFLLLGGYVRERGIEVPTSLRVYRGVPWRDGRAAATITIRSIDVDPNGLRKETMQRPSF